MAPLSPVERDAYLTRLGLDAEPPSVEALSRIHRAHAERVPYENLWIHLGERWGIDVADSVARIATQRRGGYCFHLNGALSQLLRTLGYDVTLHVGGVHGPDGPAEEDRATHLVLTVAGLPNDENPAGVWYVDVGLGDALHDPLPLVAGVHEQAPWRLVLDDTPGAFGDWHLTHDPGGGFTGMHWRSAPARMAAFAERHAWLSTAPESGFVRVLTVQTRDATGVTVLRGLTLRRIGAEAGQSAIRSPQELGAALGDLFGIDLGAVEDTRRQALWENLCRAHEAWEAAGRP